MHRVIYLDHASTTPADPEVVEAMRPWFTEKFGNSSTIYSLGLDAAKAVQQARESIAERIGAEPDEIYFTSGGTEADNWAILGSADANQKKGRHLVTSTVEHHAVLETMEYLEKRGWEVTRVPVSGSGLVDPDDVRRAIRPDTVLVSVMHANNEVGTIQPIAEIGTITRVAGVLFHTDAVQTAGKLPLDVDHLGVDMLSMSAHKLYGPKGVGLLYLRKRTRVTPLLYGGGQGEGPQGGHHERAGDRGHGQSPRTRRCAHGRRCRPRSHPARSPLGGSECEHRSHLSQRRYQSPFAGQPQRPAGRHRG